VQHSRKMKIRILTTLLLTVGLSLFGQDSVDCYEIEYLDFFGLEQTEIVKWEESQLKELLEIDFAKDRGQSEIKTNFIIPLIVYQLKEYHPNCTDEIDVEYFDKISAVYLKIREIDSTELLNKPIAEKIDYLRSDFYSQVKDVNYLPKMTATFDDGPFYGIDYDEKLDLEPLESQATEFGILAISKTDDKTILTCKDKNGNTIWQKLITGLSDRNLTELHFRENSIEYTSVATVAHMYSEGERFTLYLKKDGNFMYYYHSW
jgi:hypothetical protein